MIRKFGAWCAPRCVLPVCFVSLVLSSLVSLILNTRHHVEPGRFRETKPSFVRRMMIDRPETRLVQRALVDAFVKYLPCSHTDEFRPLTGECLGTFGFRATLVESLESLILFGDDEKVAIVKKHLGKKFCGTIGVSNRRDVWERVVASFLGSYLLTNQRYFLEEACYCARKIVRIDSQTALPYRMIDMKAEVGVARAWENGTTLADVLAGIPEMAALYVIDRDPLYLSVITKTLASLNGLAWLYDPVTGKNKTDVQVNDRAILADVHELAETANLIEPLPGLQALLDATKSFKQQDSLRSLVKDGKCSDVLANATSFIEKSRTENGFTGFVTSNLDKEYKDNIQHASFIGECISAYGLCLLEDDKLRTDSVINARGHIIYINNTL